MRTGGFCHGLVSVGMSSKSNDIILYYIILYYTILYYSSVDMVVADNMRQGSGEGCPYSDAFTGQSPSW